MVMSTPLFCHTLEIAPSPITWMATLMWDFIMSMWSQVLQGEKRTFIVLTPHTPLSAPNATHSPYLSQTGFLETVVYSQPARQQDIIQLSQIHGHVTYYNQPPVCMLIDSLQWCAGLAWPGSGLENSKPEPQALWSPSPSQAQAQAWAFSHRLRNIY